MGAGGGVASMIPRCRLSTNRTKWRLTGPRGGVYLRPMRRPLALHLVVFLAALAGFHRDVMSSTTAPRALTRVPIEFSRNQVRVPVSINGSKPFILILDTGMPTGGVLLRASERVEALGLEFSRSANLSGGGSGPAVTARVSQADHIEIGRLSIPDVPVTVMPGQSLLQETDGVIGAELFLRYAVRVDVDGKTIDLIDPVGYQPAPGSTTVPMRIREGGIAFVDAEVTVLGGQPVTADLAIDLGAGHGLWLNERKDGQLAAPAAAIETVLGHGISGEIRGSIGRVQHLELGGFVFDNVVTLFPIPEHHNPGGADFKDGFIGAEILTRFVATYDYAHKRLVLERGEKYADPFEYDMSGMVLDVKGVDSRRVDAVLAGSPAQEAGVQAGDVLTAVDGTPVASLHAEGVSQALQRDGAEVRVTLTRDGTTIEKTFRLRRLV